MDRGQLTLPDEICIAIRDYYLSRGASHDDRNYQAKFAGTGALKAQPVLDYVQERFRDLSKLVYVSIGGADGSEVSFVLKNTPIVHGILLEFSDEGAKQARIHAADLAKSGKHLEVLQGDANQRLEDCCTNLSELRSKGITGIVCSAQAVLHELPFRSPSFQLSHFFGRLFRGFDTRFFHSREPAALHSWPETVRLRFAGPPPISSAVVAALGRLIAAHFRLPREVHEVIDNYVELARATAGEVLRKILYFADQSHFVYEMGECHERFDPDEAAKVIGTCIGDCPLEVQRINTDTFALRYDQFHVEARHLDGRALQKPTAFALLRGYSTARVDGTVNLETPRLLPPLGSTRPIARDPRENVLAPLEGIPRFEDLAIRDPASRSPLQEEAGNDNFRPILRVVGTERQSPSQQQLLQDLERALGFGELKDSELGPLVLQTLQQETELEIAEPFDRRWITAGIRLGDVYFTLIRPSAGQRDWQRDFAKVATPILVGVTKSLQRSADAQAVVVRLCEVLAQRLRLKVVWPEDPDELNDSRNAIYRTCLVSHEVESDDVLVLLQGLTVVGPG